MKKIVCCLFMSMLLGGCSALNAQNDSLKWQAATVLNSQEQVFHSKFTHKDYLIQVARIGERPENGYPVMYVLDGNAFFAPSASVAQMLHGRPNETNPKSMLVVGIGYTTGRQFDIPSRTQDYTPPASSYPTPKGEQTSFGGAEAFYQFIVQELNPLLDENFTINHSQRTLLGHSYGGLFGLYALFRHGESFDNYVIASPSIWWNDKSIYQHWADFRPTPNIANVVITLGEQELNASHRNPDAQVLDLKDSEAHRMMALLKEKIPNANVDFYFNLGQTHGMNAYPSIIQGMMMAYESCRTDKECQ